MLDHVADFRLAWCTCSTSLLEQEPWPCPRPLPQQGGSSASSSWCSWDLWGRMCVCVCVFRGLGGSAGWGQCKDFCYFPVRSVPVLLECWFLQWCCLIWKDALPDSLVHPISWLMGRIFPPAQSLLGPLSPLLFWHCPHCGYIPCSPLSHISSPNTNQVSGGTGSSLYFVTCRCVSFPLAFGNALTAERVSGTQIPVCKACLSPFRPLLLKTLEMVSCLSHWFTLSLCPDTSLLEQQVELKAVDTALIPEELLLQFSSSGGLGIPACFLLGFKIK